MTPVAVTIEKALAPASTNIALWRKVDENNHVVAMAYVCCACGQQFKTRYAANLHANGKAGVSGPICRRDTANQRREKR
ncbi:MAG TPA: hypothetical protein VOA78_02885 [Candidatus Dormibacteraeota bacterium]|nr:hypothetical protein [Candidatus Dormibacteraeota bacterium]